MRESVGSAAVALRIIVVPASMLAAFAEPLRSREYAPEYQSSTFFLPRQAKIEAVGLINEDTAYGATRSSIMTLHRDGPPTPVIQVDNEEIVAFHLCHHRNSIIYEALARDGGALSIYEYSIAVRSKVLLKEFQDAVPAVSLACADQWLLRVSPSALRAIHISETAVVSELRAFEENPITSLSVAHAADIIGHAQVFVVDTGNRTISRLRLIDDSEGSLREEAAEVLLAGGDGSDGPRGVATVHSPQHAVWTNDKVLFTDGCLLREFNLHDGHVRTLIGIPACVPAVNETLEPVPWATRLSRPLALTPSTEGTTSSAALLLTEGQVVSTVSMPSPCAAVGLEGHINDAMICSRGLADTEHHTHQCGWAEGHDVHERSCFECSGLQRWAASQRPAVELCSLELAPRRDVRYSLQGCGCAPPPPAPDDIEAARIQVNLSILLVVAAVAAVVYLYRRGRRVQAREFLADEENVDIAEFHMFTDADNSLQ